MNVYLCDSCWYDAPVLQWTIQICLFLFIFPFVHFSSSSSWNKSFSRWRKKRRSAHLRSCRARLPLTIQQTAGSNFLLKLSNVFIVHERAWDANLEPNCTQKHHFPCCAVDNYKWNTAVNTHLHTCTHVHTHFSWDGAAGRFLQAARRVH